jgi:hypothetical protein
MKTLVVKEEQFLTDAKGKRTAVVLDLQTYQHLREAEEELADIQAYDSTRDRKLRRSLDRSLHKASTTK